MASRTKKKSAGLVVRAKRKPTGASDAGAKGPRVGRAARAMRESRAGNQDDEAIWLAHDHAIERAKEGGDAAQRIASATAKQRAAVESAFERARSASTRADELTSSFARVLDVFERLGLVALNAGLEGARLGENAGRALLLVSDEVRGHATRGNENARELSATLGEIGGELGRLQNHIEQARDASSDVAQQAARASSAAADAERTLLEVVDRLRRKTGFDRDTSHALEKAGEQARALAGTMTILSQRLPRDQLGPVLATCLEPLTRLVTEAKRGARDA